VASDPTSPLHAAAPPTTLPDADAVIVSDVEVRIPQVDASAADLFGHEAGPLQGLGIEVPRPARRGTRPSSVSNSRRASGASSGAGGSWTAYGVTAPSSRSTSPSAERTSMGRSSSSPSCPTSPAALRRRRRWRAAKAWPPWDQ
jgi:hypothetical protein